MATGGTYTPPAPRVQEQDLKDKTALVTGATKGIGRAIALDLATRGACVVGTYTSVSSAHNFDTLHHTINNAYSKSSSKQRYSPKVVGVAADITSLDSTKAIENAIRNELPGKLDIVVLNASYNARPKLGSASDEEISKSLTANIQWPITLIEKLTANNMLNPNSRIVVISSDRVRSPIPGSLLYSTAKAAAEGLVRSWAIELPLKFPGTTVNAVSVGLTDTPQVRGFPPEAQEALQKERLPRVRVVEGGRMGYAEDVADVVGWLCSEKSRWVTGSVVAANGGAEFIK